jgi:hypothetical protein
MNGLIGPDQGFIQIDFVYGAKLGCGLPVLVIESWP